MEDFLHAVKEIESHLLMMSFKRHSFLRKGLAYYIQYKRDDTVIEFLYGPPEFHIDIVIHTSKGKYEFKDLLQIPMIAGWFDSNRYVQQAGRRNLKDEMLWFVKLLKFSLVVVE